MPAAFLLSVLGFLSVVAHAVSDGAVFRLVPGEQQGDTIAFDVRLDAGGRGIAGVSVRVAYSENLEFSGGDASGSVFEMEVMAPEAAAHALSFTRLRISEGFTGDDGQVMRLKFRILERGKAEVTIDAASSEAITFDDSSNALRRVQGVAAELSPQSEGDGGEPQWEEPVDIVRIASAVEGGPEGEEERVTEERPLQGVREEVREYVLAQEEESMEKANAVETSALVDAVPEADSVEESVRVSFTFSQESMVAVVLAMGTFIAGVLVGFLGLSRR